MSDTDKTRPWQIRALDALEPRRAYHHHLDFGKPVYEYVDLLDADGEPVTWKTISGYRDENGEGAGKWRVEWHSGETSWHEADDLDWLNLFRRQVRSWKFALAPGYVLPFWGYPTVHDEGYRTFNPDGYEHHRFNFPVRVRTLVGHMLDYCNCRYPVPAGTPERFLPCSWILESHGGHRCSGYKVDHRRPQNRSRLAATTKHYNTLLADGGWDEEDDLWDDWQDGWETFQTQPPGWWCC